MRQQRGFIVVFIGLFSLSLVASVIGFSLVKVTSKAQAKTTAATFTLAGRAERDCTACKGSLSCFPVPGITITFTRVSGTGAVPPPAQTDALGQWSQVGFEEGSIYRVTPGEIQNTTVTPTFVDAGANAQISFRYLTFYSVSGRVTFNGVGMSGVTIHVLSPVLQGPCQYAPSTDTTGQTDANGNWTVTGLKPGLVSYRAYPVKSGYVFSSCPQWFPPVNGPLNFEASPTSLAVVSAADFNNRPGFCSYPTVVQESITTAFGQNLASTVQAAASQPLPTELAGTSVKIKDGSNTELDAPLFFVSPTQINFQVPPRTALGLASMTVMRNGATVNQSNINVDSFQPAFFTADSSGKGLPAAVAYRLKANGAESYEPISRFDPVQGKLIAVPIEFGDETEQFFLVLFGTGGKASLDRYEVTIGGTPAQVTYVGLQPSFVGVIQTNILLPRTLIGRGDAEVKLRALGREANPVTVNIR